MADDLRGPVDLLVLAFPGSHFTGELLPALERLIAGGTLRVIDMAFVRKDPDDQVEWFEGAEISDALAGSLGNGLFTDAELAAAAQDLPAGDAGALLLVEHLWAAELAGAIAAADGHVARHDRVPIDVARRLAG